MTAFDRGLLGHHCWLELATGERVELPLEECAPNSVRKKGHARPGLAAGRA